MATNAKFEIEIYGNTTKFENSLKGINGALSGLKGEAKGLRSALTLDPSNTEKIAALQKNLQQQLKVSKERATQLKKEISEVDRDSPGGDKKWIRLQRDLANTTIQADKVEAELKQVDAAVRNGKYEAKGKVDIDTSGVNNQLNGVKNRLNGLKEVAIGAFRQIGSSIASGIGSGLKGWVSDAMSTQKAMISLKNTMQFKGNAQEFDSVSKSMSKLAKDTNANTEDTLKLATTFIGLGDTAGKAVSKTEALVKANQAFGGTGENLKGVVQAYGQMSAAGKVSAENINQLTDNNTALGSALKSTVMEMNPTLKQFGSFATASEKGAITVEMLDEAMQKLGTAGGGAVTTIGDAWDSFNETLSLALLPTLEALTPVISAIIDKMAGWGEVAGSVISGIVQYIQLLYYELEKNGAIQALSGAFSNLRVVFFYITQIIGAVINSFLGINGEALKSKTSVEQVSITIKALADRLLDTTAKLAIFLGELSRNKAALEAMKLAVVAIAAAFVTLKIAGVIAQFVSLYKAVKTATMGLKAFLGLTSTASLLTNLGSAARAAGGGIKALTVALAGNPFTAIAVAIAAVIAGLVYFFTQTETGKKVFAEFIQFVLGIVEQIKTTFGTLVEFFVGVWESITATVQEKINQIVQFFTGIGTFFVQVWQNVSTVAMTVWESIITFLSGVVQRIIAFFQPLISFYQALFNLILAVINFFVQLVSAAFRGLVLLIKNIVTPLVAIFQGVWDNIKNATQIVLDALGGFVQRTVDRIKTAWNTLISVFTTVFDAIKSVAGVVFGAIAGAALGAFNTLVSVFQPLIDVFATIFNAIGSVVSTVFDAFGSIAQTAYNAIAGVFGGLYNFFADVFGGIKNLIDSVLGGVTSTINGITKAINGVSDKLGNLFQGSLVDARLSSDLSKASGMVQNSASSNDNRTYNSFTINGAGQSATDIARAVRREFNQGRA